MDLVKKLKRSLTEKRSVRFKTDNPDKDLYYGVVVSFSDEIVALAEVSSFEFDGFQVFPLSSLKRIRDGKYEVCDNDILQQNGQIDSLTSDAKLNACSTLQDVINYCFDSDIWPGIEITYKDKNDRSISAFYLGPIIKVGKNSFSIRCYDAAGKWEKEYELKYKEVFRIEVETKYCRHFNSYMRSRS